MKSIVIASLFLSTCALDPEITYRAGVRHQASVVLENCLNSPPGRPENEESCKQESARFCTERRLEKTCGLDDYWYRKTMR